MIRLRALRREYRMGSQPVPALDGVDLDVPRGELLVLMGASGSGKSTLLNIIGCLDQPTSGSYGLEGREVTTLPEPDRVRIRREKVGFIFQTFHLVPRMTALRNVELPMVFAGVEPRERRQRASETLEAVGLAHRVAHRPPELSGGERQRVAIARALAMRPPILLADEPTGNLDSKTGEEIVRILIDLNARGQTLLVVTHSEELAKIGHRILRMKDGKFL
ncbi:MAG: ABC transporter ATP-binding protein [Planctomycetes bacterium]|nr:ABC transporter ATP-binding protein [Planctomycetota bacterium]